MRVLHLHDRLSARGGADRHLWAVLEHLQGRVETLLAVGLDDGTLPQAERAAIGPWRRLKGLERGGLSARGGTGAAARLARLIADFAPNVIHLHNVMDPGLLALCAGSGRALMTVQDHRAFCPGLGKLTPQGSICHAPLGEACLACFREAGHGGDMLALTRARLAALGGMRRLLVLSRYMAGELEAAGLDPDRVAVLPPFVHRLAAPAGPPARTHHLLASRLVQRKGVAVALAAAPMMAGPLPLVVAGDGPLAAEVARAAAAHPGRLRYVGWADRPGMNALLAGAASLWLPSLWAEPFGIAGLEALALGVPVAAAEVGGVADWLEHGVTGLLLPPGDAAALARAADGLAGAGGEEMGRKGALAAARFAPGPLMAGLLDYYRQAAK
jgi:glycosyltransferase involved in cell wall biosynthesis